jgi:aryl-alcohol dehydrogenase-like predicted oxidoreductase/enamine deaminase RidA (YjgF/YER057c/UK114 family)
LPAGPEIPDRCLLAPGLEISRIVTGLWQIADMERGGSALDPDQAASAMAAYAEAGFDSFDMADHYGSAEVITGRFLDLVRRGKVNTARGARPTAFTKWCPEPGAMTPDIVRAGIQRSLDRMGVDCIDLLQLHWWTFEHPSYLDAMRELAALQAEGRIRHLGLTNFNTDHLRVLVKQGIQIVSNQICFSLLDRRAGEEMTDFCLEHGIKLLAYGTLGGGFLSERWLGAPEPPLPDIPDWSKMKYKRFIEAIGGWSVLQGIIAAAHEVAKKHHVSLANVATRWVLDQPAVGAVIVGARLGERDHRLDNLRAFSFALDTEDHARIDAALARSKRIPGDCGDEYRRPPYLTASGDLSHHLSGFPSVYTAVPVPDRPGRMRIDTGSIWESIAGYSRAMRIGDRILVSGTTATHGSGEVVCPGDPAGQAVYILDKIAASLTALGAGLDDVVRTRIYLRDAETWEAVSRVHGRYLGHVRPANTLVEVSRLVGDYEVEIEAEAVADAKPSSPVA